MSIQVDRDPEARLVTLGPWRFEIRGDELAALSFDGSSVLRAIRFVVRDENWRTVPPRVRAVEVTGSHAVIRLGFDAWGIWMSATITASRAGQSLRVEADATAESDFLGNRVGLVVLHHRGDAGAAVQVTDARGVVTRGEFPTAISPHQPFHSISRIRWQRNGAEPTLDFEGDVFEMEDQRNWTDASFKTYSTPLSEPYPVAVSAGDRVRQAVVVSVDGTPSEEASPDGPLVLAPMPAGTVMPVIGTLLEPGSDVGALAGWPLGFLQAEVALGDADAASAVDAAVAAARQLGLPLDLRVIATSPYDLAGLAALVARVPVGSAVRLGVFDSASHVVETELRDAAQGIATARGDASAVVGTRAHFTELNRTRERLPAEGSAVTFSLTSTMHAYEVAHVRDSLATLPPIVGQAAEIAGGSDIHVGPVTLEARFNAVATRPIAPDEPVIDDGALYAHPMVPAWVLGAIVQLASPATRSVSILRATGYRGLVDDGAETPAGHLVKRLAELSGSDIHSRHCDAELVAAVIGRRLFVANLTEKPLTRDIAVGSGVHRSSLQPYGYEEVSLA